MTAQDARSLMPGNRESSRIELTLEHFVYPAIVEAASDGINRCRVGIGSAFAAEQVARALRRDGFAVTTDSCYGGVEVAW